MQILGMPKSIGSIWNQHIWADYFQLLLRLVLQNMCSDKGKSNKGRDKEDVGEYEGERSPCKT